MGKGRFDLTSAESCGGVSVLCGGRHADAMWMGTLWYAAGEGLSNYRRVAPHRGVVGRGLSSTLGVGQRYLSV